MTTSLSPTLPTTPLPGVSRKSRTSFSGRLALSATRQTAWATGWREFCSTLAAASSSSTPSTPSAGAMRVTVRAPVVSVPVLSKTIAVKSPAASRCPTFFIRMPRRAAADRPATMAVGVASTKAHGQAITSTATALAWSPVNT